MDELILILIERRIDATALTPDERTLLALFVEALPEKLRQYLPLLHHWERAPASRKALALKLLAGHLSDKEVARICGLSDRHLRRCREYRAFARLLRGLGHPLPRGAKGAEGGLEAWEGET